MEEDTSCKHNQTKAKVATLSPDKVDFRAKKITRNSGMLYTDKRSIYLKDTVILNVCVPNNRAKYVNQKLRTEGEVDKLSYRWRLQNFSQQLIDNR